MAGERTHAGVLPSGSAYLIEVPVAWNGVLVVFSHPVPVGPYQPPWKEDPVVDHLVDSGYAVTGAANTIFWPLEQAFADLPALVAAATGTLGPVRHTIGLGLSIGGIITAGLVQLFPHVLSGAVSVGGNLAGAVGIHNRELDIAFVVKALLAHETPLTVAGITDPRTNLRVARRVLAGAQETPRGRARLGLAAAVGNIPCWHDPTTAEPAPDDIAARQRNQFAWFDDVAFLVYFWAREQVERQAGGNPSWNTGVDYRQRVADSPYAGDVGRLYASAGLDLDADLDRLAEAPRVTADPAALAYLERHVVFSGELCGVPVLTVHTDGDGLVTVDNAGAYAEVVAHAGQSELLRQLYVHRAGHCTTTLAELRTALDVVIERLESGRWPDHDPATLNAAAGRLGPASNTLASGEPAEPGFFDFTPAPFPRRYDARDTVRG